MDLPPWATVALMFVVILEHNLLEILTKIYRDTEEALLLLRVADLHLEPILS